MAVPAVQRRSPEHPLGPRPLQPPVSGLTAAARSQPHSSLRDTHFPHAPGPWRVLRNAGLTDVVYEDIGGGMLITPS